MSKNPFLGFGFKSPFISFSRPIVAPSGIDCSTLPSGQYLDLTSETTFDISSQETQARGIYISPDGDYMYVVGESGDGVVQYSLSIPYSITSASFVRFKSLSSENLAIQDVFFKSDGTVMFTLNDFNDRVIVYNLSTPWNVSTAVYSTFRSLGANNNILNPSGMTFSADGSYMYIFSNYLRYMHRFALNTPWNISSATQTTSQFPSNQIASAGASAGIAISADGTRLIITESNGDRILEYTLDTPYSITSTSFIGSLSIVADTDFPTGCNWSSDGKYLYVVSSNPTDSVHRYETCVDGAYKILGRS
jgi:sugar lactone lactonase YvrE